LAGNDSDAEEAVQETWIRAAERFDAFAWRSSLATWLTGIAINVCRDQLRRQRSRPQPLALEIASAPEPVRPPADRSTKLDLERAISELPPRSRLVLVLHDVEGFTHREIGEALEIADGTSKSQLFQARRILREALRATPKSQRTP